MQAIVPAASAGTWPWSPTRAPQCPPSLRLRTVWRMPGSTLEVPPIRAGLCGRSAPAWHCMRCGCGIWTRQLHRGRIDPPQCRPHLRSEVPLDEPAIGCCKASLRALLKFARWGLRPPMMVSERDLVGRACSHAPVVLSTVFWSRLHAERTDDAPIWILLSRSWLLHKLISRPLSNVPPVPLRLLSSFRRGSVIARSPIGQHV